MYLVAWLSINWCTRSSSKFRHQESVIFITHSLRKLSSFVVGFKIWFYSGHKLSWNCVTNSEFKTLAVFSIDPLETIYLCIASPYVQTSWCDSWFLETIFLFVRIKLTKHPEILCCFKNRDNMLTWRTWRMLFQVMTFILSIWLSGSCSALAAI